MAIIAIIAIVIVLVIVSVMVKILVIVIVEVIDPGILLRSAHHSPPLVVSFWLKLAMK